MANKRIDEPTGIETVGHEWDGIEELNNPLPRWWLIVLAMTVVFVALIIWAIRNSKKETAEMQEVDSELSGG